MRERCQILRTNIVTTVYFLNILKTTCLIFRCQNSYLKHVIDDVELYDRLSPYQMIHHRVVNIVHHEVTDDQYHSFEHVTHLSRLQQTSITEIQRARSSTKCHIPTKHKSYKISMNLLKLFSKDAFQCSLLILPQPPTPTLNTIIMMSTTLLNRIILSATSI